MNLVLTSNICYFLEYEFNLSISTYLTDRNVECMESYAAEPHKSKSDVDPSNLKVSFVPNWMNQLQISAK